MRMQPISFGRLVSFSHLTWHGAIDSHLDIIVWRSSLTETAFRRPRPILSPCNGSFFAGLCAGNAARSPRQFWSDAALDLYSGLVRGTDLWLRAAQR